MHLVWCVHDYRRAKVGAGTQQVTATLQAEQEVGSILEHSDDPQASGKKRARATTQPTGGKTRGTTQDQAPGPKTSLIDKLWTYHEGRNGGVAWVILKDVIGTFTPKGEEEQQVVDYLVKKMTTKRKNGAGYERTGTGWIGPRQCIGDLSVESCAKYLYFESDGEKLCLYSAGRSKDKNNPSAFDAEVNALNEKAVKADRSEDQISTAERERRRRRLIPVKVLQRWNGTSSVSDLNRLHSGRRGNGGGEKGLLALEFLIDEGLVGKNTRKEVTTVACGQNWSVKVEDSDVRNVQVKHKQESGMIETTTFGGVQAWLEVAERIIEECKRKDVAKLAAIPWENGQLRCALYAFIYESVKDDEVQYERVKRCFEEETQKVIKHRTMELQKMAPASLVNIVAQYEAWERHQLHLDPACKEERRYLNWCRELIDDMEDAQTVPKKYDKYLNKMAMSMQTGQSLRDSSRVHFNRDTFKMYSTLHAYVPFKPLEFQNPQSPGK